MADYYFNVERRERLRHVADVYFNVEISKRDILQALSFFTDTGIMRVPGAFAASCKAGMRRAGREFCEPGFGHLSAQCLWKFCRELRRFVETVDDQQVLRRFAETTNPRKNRAEM